MGKVEISKEVLQDLYWNREFSLAKIAEEVGMKSPASIAFRMDKFGVPRRPSDRKDYLKIPFGGDLLEKAYMLGLRAGDIHAFKKNNTVAACATSTKNAQIEMFMNVFGKYGYISAYAAKGGYTLKTTKANIHLDSSFDFLVEKPQNIPEWILNNDRFFYLFLSGYCDSEASWIITAHKKYSGKWKDLVFSLGTCDKRILEQINQKLMSAGFNSHLYLVRKKGVYGERKCNFDLYRVMLTNHTDVINLAKIMLPLSKHKDKINAMLKIVDYGEKWAEQKLLKKQSLGTISIGCIHCNNTKVWKSGSTKYKNKAYLRYKCPACGKEFQKGHIILNCS